MQRSFQEKCRNVEFLGRFQQHATGDALVTQFSRYSFSDILSHTAARTGDCYNGHDKLSSTVDSVSQATGHDRYHSARPQHEASHNSSFSLVAQYSISIRKYRIKDQPRHHLDPVREANKLSTIG